MKSLAYSGGAALLLLATWTLPNGLAQQLQLTSKEECDALLAAAESPEELVRLNAFTRLEAQWPAFRKLAPQAVPKLVAVAYQAADSDNVPSIRGQATIISAGLTESIIQRNLPAVIECAGRGDRSAADLLVRRRDEQALPELLKRWRPSANKDSVSNGLAMWLCSAQPGLLSQLANHADPRVRRALAKFALGSGQQRDELQKLLANMWNDVDADVAKYALEGLASWGGPLHDPQGALERMVRNPAPELAQAALRAWLKVAPDSRTRLAALLRDEDPRVRAMAAFETSDDILTDPAITALFVHGVDSADANEARICFERLVTVRNAAALPRMILLACDPESPNRIPAINAIAALGEQASSASPYLHLCLRHAEGSVVRRSLVRALGAIGPSAMHAVADLQDAVDPKNVAFSVTCLEAIDRIDASAARTSWLLVKYAQLIEAAETRNGQNLAGVGPSLAKLGARARPLAPLVAEGLSNASARTARYALDALERMEAGDAATIESLLAYAGRSKAPIQLRKRALGIVAQRCEDASAAQDALIDLVLHGPEDIRPEALRCCAAIGVERERLSPLVASALQGASEDLVQAALGVVAERRVAGDAILAGVTGQLRTAQSDTASRAILALGDAAADAAPHIADVAASDADERRLHAVRSLWSIAAVSPDAITALQQAARGALERRWTTMANLALGQLKIDDAVAPAAHVEEAAKAP